jgi:hypothetical protein
MQRLSLAAACLLMAAASAFANDVPFQTIGNGVGGFGHPAGEFVAKSRAELDQQDLDRFLTQQELDGIDWGNEMVIALFMGEQSTGGHSISVTSIERRQLMQILPVPGPPPAFELAVNVLRVHPGPGDIVTMAFTAPYQIVKLARSDDRINFYDVPSRIDFDNVTRSVGGGWGYSRSISVARDGAVEVHSSGPGFGGVPRTDRGTADAGQLDRLRRALALADFASIPADMGIDPNAPVPMDVPHHTYLLDANGSQQRVSGIRMVAPDAITARLSLIDRELDVIMEAVLPAFDSLTFSTTEAKDNDFLTISTSVNLRGEVTVQQQWALKEIHYMPVHGQVPENLIDDLNAAISYARVGELPADMAPVGALHIQKSFKLRVNTIDGQRHETQGDADHLPTQYRFRMERVFDAATAVRDHLLTHAGREEFKGTVQVNGDTVTLEGPHTSVEIIDPATARLVRNWEGRTVKLEGELQQLAPNSAVIRDATVLYPRHQADLRALVVMDAAGAPTLVYGFGAAAGKVPTFGAASAALALGEGNTVTVDAYTFLDANERPEEYFVASVQATVKRFSWQTIRGTITGYLRRGDVVQIDRLSRTGRYARTSDHETTGYVRVNRLQVGDAAGPQPFAPAAGAGITGSLPGGN